MGIKLIKEGFCLKKRLYWGLLSGSFKFFNGKNVDENFNKLGISLYWYKVLERK